MKRRKLVLGEPAYRVNLSNYVSKLRRMRWELGELLQRVDDALVHIEEPAHNNGESDTAQ